MSEDVERVVAEANRRYPDPHPHASGLNSPRRIAFKAGAEWAIAALTTTPQVVTVEDRIERIERHLGLVSIGVDCTDAILNPEAGR